MRNYSKRSPADSVYGGPYVPWVNVNNFPNPYTGWLGVMVDGLATDWSSYFNPAHQYVLGRPNHTGAFDFKILDDVYSDNSGSIPVDIYKGYAGTTGNDGCVTFADVPLGTYTVGEVMQDGWVYVSGDAGQQTVNSATETFTLVNRELPRNPSIVVEKTGPEYVASGDAIAYEYVVTNTGDVPLSDVSISDDKCSEVAYVSGDTDSDNLLDLTETWNYTCSMTPEWIFNTTLTNRATVTGHYNQQEVTNTDDFTLQSFILRKDVRKTFEENFSDPNTSFSVEVKKGETLLGTMMISESDPAEMWLANNGTYEFCEINMPTQYTPHYTDGCLNFVAGQGNYPDWTEINYIKPVKIVTSKIVCDSETDLPNWGTGASNDITANTAARYVAANPSCHLEEGWQFEWGYNGVSNPGDDFVGTAETGSGWTTFGSTVDIFNPTQPIKFREVLQEDYLPFSYTLNGNTNVNDVSAEFYCGNDVVNYDNEEWLYNTVPGETYYCVAWNVKLQNIHGFKWEDVNGNGEYDCQSDMSRSVSDGPENIIPIAPTCEPKLSGWTINLYQWNGEGYSTETIRLMETSSESKEFGWYWFEDLLPGKYKICEVLQTGWEQTSPNNPNCHEVTLPNDNLQTLNGVLAPEYNFGNFFQGIITGIKYEDCNGNGQQDDNEEFDRFVSENQYDEEEDNTCREAGLSGWTIYLDLDHDGTWDDDEPSQVTDEDGSYSFTGLSAGNYSVREVLKEGWKQTDNRCVGSVFSDDAKESKAERVEDGVDIESRSSVSCLIGNMHMPRLSIEKWNDKTGGEHPGSTVRYHIRVTAHDNDVRDVEVTDLPPAGFVYVSGSGSGAPFHHEYASPGVWDLGNMTAGQSIELAYDTTISAAQDAGDYPDLAYARGTSEIGDPVIADDLLGNNFVGTNVAITIPETPSTVVVPEDNENKKVEKTKKKTQYVLGASTLPMTGVNAGVLGIVLLGLVSGLVLLFLAHRRKMTLPVLGVLFFASLVFGAPQGVEAATLGVQLEKPEAVVSSADFKIGFVVLDISDRAITVECWKSGDGAAFETQALVSGGNSGDCQVSSAVMPADGDYEFYVKAIASGEGSETAESNHVNVKLVSTVPGTPYNYDRHDGSCMNTMTFTTADDAGKTVKVELYRSLATVFTADTSTFLTEQAIGSNANGTFSIVAPGCSNDYYYALRAVDTYGNGSGFVGDKDVNVDTHTVTHTKTKTVTLPGTTTTGALAVAGGAGAAEGQVQGAETVNEENNQIGAEQPKGSVLGESTEQSGENGGWMDAMKAHPWRTAFLILIALFLGYRGYQYYQGRYDRSIK